MEPPIPHIRNISPDLTSSKFSVSANKTTDGREDHKPPKIDLKHPDRTASEAKYTVEDIRKHSPLMLSPRSHADNSNKPLSGGKWNCLCSPTTHAGSFRCRLHRNAGAGIPRGRSIGSNLSDLATKSGGISDTLHAQ